MQNENLPTEDLKMYGIINSDNTFTKKLSADDIQKFLQGYTIVADNEKNRATFQLTENNTKLKAIFLERDKSLSEVLENSKKEIQYSDAFSKYNVNDKKNTAQLNWTKTAFVFDEKNQKTIEFDLIKDTTELTAIIADKKDVSEMNRYKTELQKLKNFLLDKLDQYPEIAKEIGTDLNIVSKTIDSVNSISPDEKQTQMQNKSDIQLNVNDYDLYEDANKNREQQEEETEEREKSRRFKR